MPSYGITEEAYNAHQAKHGRGATGGFDEAQRRRRIKRSHQQRRSKNHPLTGFLRDLQFLGLPAPTLELVFHSERKWRFDAAWESQKIAIEYNGIFEVKNGAHQATANLMRDYEKSAEAQLLGWIVLTVTAESIRTGKAHEWVRKAFEQRGFKLE